MEIGDEWQLGKTFLNMREETTDRPCVERERSIYRENVAEPLRLHTNTSGAKYNLRTIKR